MVTDGAGWPWDDVRIGKDAGNAIETLREAGWLVFDLGGGTAGPFSQRERNQ
jgi:hypothetical protein